jgi:uncharacterized protein
MATVQKPKKPPRSQVPQDRLCEYCTAKCCRYFALPLDTPKNRDDFDFIRWYLLHDFATVFVDEGTWYLLVHTVCQHLGADNRCGIYDTRPQICRDYSTKNCEYEDDAVYDMYFETPEQVSEYVEAVLGDKSGEIRSPRPALLPVIA